MYEVNGKDGTLFVTCQVVKQGVDYRKIIEASYSSGMPHSIFPYDHIESSFTKEMFADTEPVFFDIPNSGKSAIEFYALDVVSLVIGNDIVLGNQRIWISFDPMITDGIIGYDILSQLTRMSVAGSGKELFFNSLREFKEYAKLHL